MCKEFFEMSKVLGGPSTHHQGQEKLSNWKRVPRGVEIEGHFPMAI